jgi:hypothetical protein
MIELMTRLVLVFFLFVPSKGAGLESSEFCEGPLFRNHNLRLCQNLGFLTHAFLVSSREVFFSDLHKIREDSAMATLFDPRSLPPLVHYERLFRSLPGLPIPAKHSGPGRPGFGPNALLRAHIYRALRRIPRLTDLAFELTNNTSILAPLGFDPLRPTPGVERFSAFLHDTPHAVLQDIHHQLVLRLIQRGAIQPRLLAIDSCPIPAAVRENNLKTGPRSNRFDKTQPPKGDPQAGLGVRIHYLSPTAKKVTYFWGYRNHVVTDPESEIPSTQITLPANASEVPQAIPLLREAVTTYHLVLSGVLGDAEYDVEDILKFIVEELHAKPYIPPNPRNKQTGHYRLVNGQVRCLADLPMIHKGRMTPKNITYIQYVCPLHYRLEQRQRHLFCPAQHPKYLSQKGCNVLVRQTPSIRTQIEYGSEDSRLHYNQRTAAERVFSRLLALAMQEPTVIGLQATKNYCTIAHIATCLVALVAHEEGHADKLRFVRSFVPNFLT